MPRDLRDQVNHAGESHDEGAPGPEELAIEPISHVVGQREATRRSQLFCEKKQDHRKTEDVRETGGDGHATDVAGECQMTHDRTAMHQGRHVGHDHHRNAETTTGNPEVLGGLLRAERYQADGDHRP